MDINIKNFIEKVDAMKKEEKMDLSSDQDLSIGLMNLISIEEHFFFTGAKTGKASYYDLLQEVRKIRTELLKRIIKNPEGEEWCISKHLLAASMRVMEAGTKKLGIGKKEEAEELFKKAYDIYSLFWAINLKAVDLQDVSKIDNDALDKDDKEKKGFTGKLRELIKKAIDCCIE